MRELAARAGVAHTAVYAHFPSKHMSESQPIFDQFNLVVRDMDAAVAFYRRLGVVFRDGDPEWVQHHRTAKIPGDIDFELDSVQFAQVWNRGWPGGAGGQTGVVGFRVSTRDDVDRLYHDLTGAGYRGQQPPHDQFWGARHAVVEDPDGNAVGLMSPVDPARRTAPPPPPDSG